MPRIFITLFVILCALSACSVRKYEQPLKSLEGTHSKVAHTVMPVKYDYKTERRFNELFLEAVRQKQLEHYDDEFVLLDEALRLKPDASEALFEMAMLKLTFTTYSDTLSRMEGDSLLRLATELAPDNLHYKEVLATYFANNAQYGDAIRLYEEIAEAKLDNEVLATLIWLYKNNGDYPGAIRTIGRLERLDGRSEMLSMEKFQTYLAMGDDARAYQAIEELCAEYPLDLRYRVLLGDLYDKNGYHERALDIYRDVLTAEPDNSYAQISLLAYYKAAEADSLYMDYLKRVVLNPRTQHGARLEAMRTYSLDNITSFGDSIPVLNLFRQILSQPQETREMAELMAAYVTERKMPVDSLLYPLDKMLEVEPDYTKARLMKLQLMLSHDRFEESLQICQDGELYDPSEVTFYYYEAAVLYRKGKDMEAIRVLQRGAERIDDHTDAQLASDHYALLGDILHEKQLKEEAYLSYDRSLEYNELNLLCLNNYAYFLSLDGKNLEKAEKMSRLTVEAERDNPTYLDTYAWILFQMGRYTQADIYMQQALRNIQESPENASYFDHAGDIAYRCGERKAALEYWKTALRLTTDKELKKKVQRKVWRRRI